MYRKGDDVCMHEQRKENDIAFIHIHKERNNGSFTHVTIGQFMSQYIMSWFLALNNAFPPVIKLMFTLVQFN